MAPTICSEKESQVRRIMRRRSSSSSVISYVGKITHRRTVTMRNASSKLASSRLSDKLSSCESDSNEDSLQSSKMDLKHIKDSDSVDSSRNSPALSEMSTSQDCSDRFTPVLTPDSGYMTPLRNEQTFCDANVTSASRIMLSLHEEDSSSCMTSPLEFSETFVKTNTGRKRKNSKGLLGIAIKTIKLIKRNQLLQEKLAQLQFETRAFIQSVMANPENRALRDKMETSTNSE